MAAVPNVSRVEDIIGYQFKDKALLRTALTAAHSGTNEDGEEESYEGNRDYAQLGESLASFVVNEWGFKRGAGRGKYFC